MARGRQTECGVEPDARTCIFRDRVKGVEAMVASGPHGNLDEYLSAVTYLLSVRQHGDNGTQRASAVGSQHDCSSAASMALLFPREGGVISKRSAEQLLRTAVEDLEFEFRDLLTSRSEEAEARFSTSELQRLCQEGMALSRNAPCMSHSASGSSSASPSANDCAPSAGRRTAAGGGGDESDWARTSTYSSTRTLLGRPPSRLGTKAGGDSAEPDGVGFKEIVQQLRLDVGDEEEEEEAEGGMRSAADLWCQWTPRPRQGSKDDSAAAAAAAASSSSSSSSSSRASPSPAMRPPAITHSRSRSGPAQLEADSGRAALLELMPARDAASLGRIAEVLEACGAGARCREIYRTVRTEMLKRAVAGLEWEAKLLADDIPSMDWPSLEATTKDWAHLTYTLAGLLLGMERRLAARVWRRHEDTRRALLRGVLLDGGLCLRVLFLAESLRAIAARGMAEQLFSLLDAHQAVEEVTVELEEVVGELRLESVRGVWRSVPSLLARAVANSFSSLRSLLEDVPSPSPSSSPGPSPTVARKSPRAFSLRRLLHQQPAAEAEDEGVASGVFEVVPRDGGVAPITSYVANYVRSYMERAGKWNYIDSLQDLFLLMETDDSPYCGRSMEGETAHVLAALRSNLEARARLYPDEAQEELFLMNNLNYLVHSISQWHGWRTLPLGSSQHVSKVCRDGARSLTAATADLKDMRVVHHHAAAFQSRALSRVMGVLCGSDSDFCDASGSASPSTARFLRLRRFNTAFEELQRRQRLWRIPDAKLRKWVRAQWGTTLKERYRKTLLPQWEELTNCKAYVYSPESVEAIIVETFFAEIQDSPPSHRIAAQPADIASTLHSPHSLRRQISRGQR